MGKKSRKKTSNRAAASTGNTDLSSSGGSALQNLVAEAIAEAPANGWASELKTAEEAYRRNPNDVDAVLQLLKRLLIMRRWEKGTRVAKDARALVLKNEKTTEDERRKFLMLNNQLQQILPSRPMTNDDKDFCRSIFAGTSSPDTTVHEDQSFGNLNPLQFAAKQGQVQYFECLVAVGASIDYPPLPIESVRRLSSRDVGKKALAPESWTALLLICSTLAMDARVPLVGRQLKKTLENQVEIAIQLVKLGADTSAVLGMDGDGEQQRHHSLFSSYRKLGVIGKTAFELAKMSKRKKLVDVMTEFQSQDVLKTKGQCRCGSRLPFKLCHGCNSDNERHLMREGGDGRLCFRYSPLASCPCNNTKMAYYDCCWKGAKMLFNNDRTGECFWHAAIPMTAITRPMLTGLIGETGDGPGFSGPPPGMSDSKRAAESIRSETGSPRFHEIMSADQKSRRFDRHVYAGCLERIPNCFFWRDDHWRIDKSELVVRVKEWNEALEQYCDDEGLTSEKRESVVALHKASPFAPCGDPDCDLVETKVKEFQNCSRCRTIGYCSKKCQRRHWKSGHKKECII